MSVEEGSLDSFLLAISEEARGKVRADVEFGLVINLGGFQTVRLTLSARDFPLASKSFEQAYAELSAKVRTLLRESGYPVEVSPRR